MVAEFEPVQFISEEIEVQFDEPPLLTKRPKAPDGFCWQQEQYQARRVLSAWTDYERRGNMAKNMQPAHLRLARKKGSWGVGRFYFRLETQQGRVFDLYYDRAPEGAADRAGHWYLWRELERRDAD